MNKLTQEDLFGDNGIIPLTHFTGFHNATCTHCGSLLRGVNFPPPGIIVLHTCPSCKGLIIPFAGRLAAIEKIKLDRSSNLEQQFHIAEALYAIITPILSNVIRYKDIPPEIARTFLKEAFDIIYDMVGEKEDQEAILERLNKIAEEAADSKDSVKAKAIEAYYDQLSKMLDKGAIKISQKMNDKRLSSYKETLSQVNTIDEFLKVFCEEEKK